VAVGANALSVTFDPAVQTTEGRWMACSGGWDWAAYSYNSSMGQSADGPSLARTLSSGLWRSVYVISVRSSSITAISPLVYYTGAYPTAPLSDATAAPFNVSTRVHFYSPAGASGTLTVAGAWGQTASVPLTLPAGEVTATVNLAASGVALWWPNGYGAQPLYAVTATFTPSSGKLAPSTTRNIGFRYAALVTFNDTNAAAIANASTFDGTFNNGMFFRVNGAAVWARGANMIPMDEFEGRYSAAAHERVVMSARDGGMNMLRVWGGGIFQPPSFYDTCDALGIMVYHDMQYAQDGHSPLDGSKAQAAEFRHQVRRLAAHPSIVVFDGCNECRVVLGTPTGVYATFVLTIVESEDDSRAIWPSCPSEGWKNGVRGLDAHPNGSPLGLNPQAKPPTIARASLGTAGLLDSAGVLASTAADCAGTPCNCTATPQMDIDGDGTMIQTADAASCCVACTNISNCMGAVYVSSSSECWIKYEGGTPVPTAEPNRLLLLVPGRGSNQPMETHGPYQHGGGTPAVNGDATIKLFPALTPITVSPTMASVVLGVAFPNTFASEFGASVFSSFESMAPTLAPAHWGVHGGAPPDACGSGFERVCNGSNTMAQRNYPCDNIITVYFGASDFDAVGETAFKKHLWQCMVGQSLLLKGTIETRRAMNQFGHLLWQLNEIW
jgi:beta-mannosidase